jgi:hypothetical protein
MSPAAAFEVFGFGFLNFSCLFYFNKLGEITCNEFSAKLCFALRGLRGFPRIQGLDSILGASGSSQRKSSVAARAPKS